MSKKSLFIYSALFVVHVFLAMVAFIHLRLHPHDVLFSNYGDGIKNIFTLTSYVREPLTADGIFKYNSFQYPFGDYVYYTDNTPLFSIPFRSFCHHVYDLSADTMVIFYTIIVLNIILCGLLLFYILRRFTGENTISFLMAIILPWANMQVLRIWAGHNSFSFSSLILLSVFLVMQWHKYRGYQKKQLVVALFMCLLSFLSFLAQGYYLAIITIFISSMLFFYGCYYREQAYGRFSMVMSAGYTVGTAGFTAAVLAVTDKYLYLRRDHPGGYDWMETKVRFTNLFTHYSFQNVVFPISGKIPETPETAAYLGNVGLYAMLIFGAAMLLSRQFRSYMFQIQKDFFRDPLKASVVLGSLVMLSVSFGENYYTADPYDKGLHLINILNPLFYIHFFTRRVEQFRCIERFVWPFFFVFNIWITWTIAAVYQVYGRRIKVAIITGIVFFGTAELYDFTNEMQHNTAYENVFSPENVKKISPPLIQFSKYQAILPIPYYYVGSEEDSFTIGDVDGWCTATYQMSLNSRLPLMSCKMSRTPPFINKMLDNFVANDSVAPDLFAKLNDKPILVVVNKKLQADGANISQGTAYAAMLYARCLEFPKRHHLQAIDSTRGEIYYEYYPKAIIH